MTIVSNLYEKMTLAMARDLVEGGDKVAILSTGRPWFLRGASHAFARFSLPDAEFAVAACYGIAYEAGALGALRLATGILSDPAVRGHEVQALASIAGGADHAAVLAHLRASARQEHSAQGNVVTLSRAHTAPIASKGELL